MKKSLLLGLTIIFVMVFAMAGCGGGKQGSNSPGNPGGPTYTPGQASTYTIDDVSFAMHYVPAISSFPSGASDSGSDSTNVSYWLGETEVTYELWTTVYTWATGGTGSATGEGQYTFSNAGRNGSANSGSNQQPVTGVYWTDVLVWCNALTEYCNAKNGTSYKCVYYTDTNYATPIRSTGASNIYSPYIYAAATGNTDLDNCTAKGFRLPSFSEHMLASRYINDKNNNGILESGEYYPGSYASGADAQYDVTTTPTTDIDGDGDHQTTADVAVYNTTGTAAVKSKTNGANALGFYDLTGNAQEWWFNSYGSSNYRCYCSSVYDNTDSKDMRLCLWGYNLGNPTIPAIYRGFRIARTE
jgi:hypothetical protein